MFEEKIAAKDKLLTGLAAERDLIKLDLVSIQKNFIAINKLMTLNEQVKMLLQAVIEYSQQAVVKRLEQIVTSALNTVYGPGHSFIIKLEISRNQQEASFFIDDGNTCIQLKKPFIGKGGGKVTIAAFALQLAVIESSNITGPLFLDEITKYVDSEAVNNVAILLREYSRSSGRQVINITHHEAVARLADVKIRVNKNANGVAEVITS